MIEITGAARAVSLRPFTALRAGGAAERFITARTSDDLVRVASIAQHEHIACTTLGSGSNVLPSDAGVHGLVVHNRATQITHNGQGVVEAETGCSFQDLFLKTAQWGLAGMEFAVGIPGTLGGALVSNAGAYRSNVSEFLTDLYVVYEGEASWVKPSFMQFSYRDSILRKERPPACTLVKVRLNLPFGRRKEIFDEAREYQRQRISKQPPPASAGSFFKNVEDRSLADRLPALPSRLKEAGVVPAGFLVEAVGLSGLRHGGAQIARRHANFIVNVGGASATAIRDLAEMVKARVRRELDVNLEEEVLYLGDWRSYTPPAGLG